MSAPPSAWLSNSTYNKLKGSYVNGDIDVSQNIIIRGGNLYLSANSNIYSPSNQIYFNETYQYTNFANNVHVFGTFQLDRTGTTYDIGYEIVDNIKPSIATLTNKTTNLSYTTGTTTFDLSNNATLILAPTSIPSTAINNNSFLALTGSQSCSGNKTFAGNIIVSSTGNGNFNGLLQALGTYLRVDGDLKLGTNTITITQATLQKLQYLSTLTSDVQVQINNINTSSLLTTANTWSLQNTFSNNLRLDGSLLVGSAGATILTNATLEKIQYLSGVTASIQGTLDNCAKIGISNTFSQQQVFSNATNSIRVDGGLLVTAGTLSIPNTTLAKIQYLSTVSSDIQTQVNGCAKPNVNNNFSVSQTITSNLRLDGNLLVGSAGGTSISNTILTYLSGLTSNIQTQINNVSTANFVSLATTQIISGLKTFSSLITANGGITTGASAITTPKVQSTGDLEITTPTSNTLYLNSNKTNGDIRINTASFNSTTYIDNGVVNISNSSTGTGLTINQPNSTKAVINSGSLTGGGTLDYCEALILSCGGYGLQLQGGVKQGVGDQFNICFNNGGAPINLLTAVNTGTPATNALNLTGKLIINGIDILNYQPLGTIIQNVSGSLGSPYLLCDGSAVSRTTYSALFALISTFYGAGDGSTTFNVPNYQGMFLRGQGTQSQNGVAYSSATNPYTFQADALQDHNHGGQSGTYLASTNGSVSGYGWAAVATQRPNSNTFTNTSGVTAAYRSSTETRPANFSVWYYIRAL